MKWKNLIPLIGVFVILLGLVVLRQSQERPISLEDAVALSRMIPEGVDRASIERLELYAGFEPDDRVVLERDSDRPDEWIVSTHYNAPADQDKVREFLAMLDRLRGELRESNPAHHERYGLQDADALYISGYSAGSETPDFTLLVGRQAQDNQAFVRQAESDDVYLVNHNPKRDAGIWQDDPPESPSATPWLDKIILALDTDHIEHIEMVSPYKQLAFVREVTTAGSSPEADIPEALDPDAGLTPEPPAEPVVVWTLVSGGPGTDFKHPGLDAIVNAFDTLRATEIVDHTTPEAWGLDAPEFLCTVRLSDAAEPVIIEGGRSDPTGNGYVRVQGRETVYQVAKNTFERIFGLGRSVNLFDLEGFDVDADEMARIEVRDPEHAFVLEREEDDWTVETPGADFDYQHNTLNTVANGFANWQPADYVDAGIETGLDEPTQSITVTLMDGETYTLHIGDDSTVLDGAYAQKAGDESVYLASRSDLDRMFPQPRDLYARQVFDIREDDIVRIHVERDDDAYVLERDDEVWTITVDDESEPADAERVQTLMFSLVDLEATDILFDQSELEAIESVRIITEDDTEFLLEFAPEEDDRRLALASHIASVFAMDAFDAGDILLSSEALIAEDPDDAIIEEPEPLLDDEPLPFDPEDALPMDMPMPGPIGDDALPMMPIE